MRGDSQANKCGRILSSLGRLGNITFINSSTNGKLLNNSAIDEEFHQYYTILYNLTPQTPTPRPHSGNPIHDLFSYIQETALPTIAALDAEDLDSAMSETDFQFAITKILKMVKARVQTGSPQASIKRLHFCCLPC